MGKTLKLMILLALLVLLILLGACSTESFGQLHAGGESVINSVCKNCHGVNGIGGFAPSLDNRLGCTFQNAKQVYDKMRSDMPRNKPGSLSTMEYRQALSYVLLENGLANEGDIFEVGTLSDIKLPECPS